MIPRQLHKKRVISDVATLPSCEIAYNSSNRSLRWGKLASTVQNSTAIYGCKSVLTTGLTVVVRLLLYLAARRLLLILVYAYDPKTAAKNKHGRSKT